RDEQPRSEQLRSDDDVHADSPIQVAHSAICQKREEEPTQDTAGAGDNGRRTAVADQAVARDVHADQVARRRSAEVVSGGDGVDVVAEAYQPLDQIEIV